MNIEEFREYCLNKPHVTEDFPFGPETLVYKVKGKIFAITGLNDERFKVNLKCEPEKAILLRDSYTEVQPGYHMNKKHWNTVDFEGRVGNQLLKEWIDHSFHLVVKSLKFKDQFECR
ncbi:MAG: MmcQ/YjbR family DNA-binding protein [Saprospiraceae bacterium]|nr:MmcQ/YjbR family DNA-binding protein [Saprospiraceae bacterium]